MSYKLTPVQEVLAIFLRTPPKSWDGANSLAGLGLEQLFQILDISCNMSAICNPSKLQEAVIGAICKKITSAISVSLIERLRFLHCVLRAEHYPAEYSNPVAIAVGLLFKHYSSSLIFLQESKAQFLNGDKCESLRLLNDFLTSSSFLTNHNNLVELMQIFPVGSNEYFRVLTSMWMLRFQ
jgi:hypothetical protein